MLEKSFLKGLMQGAEPSASPVPPQPPMPGFIPSPMMAGGHEACGCFVGYGCGQTTPWFLREWAERGTGRNVSSTAPVGAEVHI